LTHCEENESLESNHQNNMQTIETIVLVQTDQIHAMVLLTSWYVHQNAQIIHELRISHLSMLSFYICCDKLNCMLARFSEICFSVP
jgi:hypothetical protein